MTDPLQVSAAVAAGMLEGAAAVLDADPAPAAVLFYAATASSTFGATPTEPHLVAVPLNRPLGTVGAPAPDLGIDPPPPAVLALAVAPAPEGMVAASGTIAWARLVDGAGIEHVRVPAVGLTGSGAPIEVDTLVVYAGGLVRIVGGVLY